MKKFRLFRFAFNSSSQGIPVTTKGFDLYSHIDDNYDGSLNKFRGDLLKKNVDLEFVDDSLFSAIVQTFESEFEHPNCETMNIFEGRNIISIGMMGQNHYDGLMHLLEDENNFEFCREEFGIDPNHILTFREVIRRIIEDFDDTRGAVIIKPTVQDRIISEEDIESFRVGYAELLHYYHLDKGITDNNVFSYNMVNPMQDTWCLNALEDDHSFIYTENTREIVPSDEIDVIIPKNLRMELKNLFYERGFKKTKFELSTYHDDVETGLQYLLSFFPCPCEELSLEEILGLTLGDREFRKSIYWCFPRWIRWIIAEEELVKEELGDTSWTIDSLDEL